MTLRLPGRVFYSLQEMESLWNVNSSNINQWLVHGDLHASVWLPLTVIYEISEQLEGNRIIQTRELLYKEGYMQVCHYDCRSLFRYGKVELRAFCNEYGERSYVLPDEGLSFFVQASELVILEEERMRFERDYRGLASELKTPSELRNFRFEGTFDRSFKTVHYEGQEYLFGDIQAAVLRKLYEIADTESPWMHGKQLLAYAGSTSLRMVNNFKRIRIWRTLITSDGRGRYRLSEGFLASINGRDG